ncbi:helix-turn-helix domain-containing protein [Virgibacillus sp.]|nr:helix-turn-helix domain-containing protein [Virgibacillus sp.]NWO14895.1 hypothetical protein [Virgibacillus sp.]
MLDIGSIIKLQRTKRNMTQEELSAGIVSLSYLSKITSIALIKPDDSKY